MQPVKIAQRFQNIQPSGMLKIFQAAAAIDDLSNLGIGEPDFHTEPKIVDAAAKAAKEGMTHYPPLTGYPELHKEICAYRKRHHNLEVAPEEIHITVGGIQAFIQYVRSFTQPITQVANIANVLQQTAAAAERVFEFLEEPEESTDEEAYAPFRADSRLPAAAGRIAFERVSFGYEPGKAVIRNFGATVEPGQKIAIVGPTGAGKTTMVKLLMRFYDLQSGAITIDGKNIRLFKRGELRSLFGMVLQDTWLFNGTIADNIRYGNLEATEEEVRRAAVVAQADHFVRTLPGGYDMVLNEEADNISQGQKQLLTIARAILADPQILILDEATSNVDTRTEVLIQKAMDNLMRGRTSFVIAHRLSTIRNADLILVMDDGAIIEQGKHAALLSQNGFYADLYYSQFEKAGSF